MYGFGTQNKFSRSSFESLYPPSPASKQRGFRVTGGSQRPVALKPRLTGGAEMEKIEAGILPPGFKEPLDEYERKFYSDFLAGRPTAARLGYHTRDGGYVTVGSANQPESVDAIADRIMGEEQVRHYYAALTPAERIRRDMPSTPRRFFVGVQSGVAPRRGAGYSPTPWQPNIGYPAGTPDYVSPDAEQRQQWAQQRAAFEEMYPGGFRDWVARNKSPGDISHEAVSQGRGLAREWGAPMRSHGLNTYSPTSAIAELMASNPQYAAHIAERRAANDAISRPRFAPGDVRRLMFTAKRQGAPITEPLARYQAKINRGEEPSLLETAMLFGPEGAMPHPQAMEHQAEMERTKALGDIGAAGMGGPNGSVPPGLLENFGVAQPQPQTVAERISFIGQMSSVDGKVLEQAFSSLKYSDAFDEKVRRIDAKYGMNGELWQAWRAQYGYGGKERIPEKEIKRPSTPSRNRPVGRQTFM